MPEFSFVILTFNEEQHLPGLFASIAGLDAPVFVLDSGSTDRTLDICREHGAQTAVHSFHNHPTQWDKALKIFDIPTPWTIGLDADQQLDRELHEQLRIFRSADAEGVNGIYFSRKYFFKGTWIRHGGYHPLYLLKMFRTGVGYSDLNENMDHRFVVTGATRTWKTGHLLEENFKENAISFWLDKHNRYSTLVAEEEWERRRNLRRQEVKAVFWGNPDQRRAWLKRLWWRLPLYGRPFLYFTHRMVFQLGFLDGKNGIVFHFLHAFWFRLIVDIKIDELRRKARVFKAQS